MPLIKTPLRGTKQESILDTVIGQLSDGMWENSPRMTKYWRFAHVIMVDEVVIINVSDNYWERGQNNPYLCEMNGNGTKIKEWFAKKIKQIVKQEIKDNDYWKHQNIEWKRDNQTVLKYFKDGTTVADCYKAYDLLLGRC